jgi:hypothetical protein
MANRYSVFQDVDGHIKVRKLAPLGLRLRVRDHNGKVIGPFTTQKSAEDAIQQIEHRKREDARAKKAAIDAAGVKFVFNCVNDEDLTIRNKFRIMRTSSVEEMPFYLQELTTNGWVTLYDRVDNSWWKRKRKTFSSEAFAKTELLAIVQKLQEKADRIKRARVLTVIDSRVYDHSAEDQVAATP